MQVLEVIEQEDGSAILEMDVDILEYASFVKFGHRANPKEFDDAKCFELGVVQAIKLGIKECQEKESS